MYMFQESQDETSNIKSSQLVSPPSPVDLTVFHQAHQLIRKYKKLDNQKKRKDAIDAALKEGDEFDGIGLNVACKLHRTDGDQKLYAKMIINKVLMHGMKGMLQEETDLLGLKFV